MYPPILKLSNLYAKSLGLSNASLWISKVEPGNRGEPNMTIDDNLSLLKDTLWRD